MDYTGKCIKNFRETGMPNEFCKGDSVYIRVYDNGRVLVLRLYNRQQRQPNNDVLFDSIKEAKQYFTCRAKANIDVEGMHKKMLSDRYW